MKELYRDLGRLFARTCDAGRLIRLATQSEFPKIAEADAVQPQPRSLQVAIAYDDAFHCYFPDTLDVLELYGATVCDFSPLRDERLPPDTDIVYFGCGRTDLFADRLLENTCLVSALREHFCSGQRIYAECGGLAYLSRHIELPDGSRSADDGHFAHCHQGP